MSHCRPYSGTFTGEAGPSGRIPPRSEIPQEYTWNWEASSLQLMSGRNPSPSRRKRNGSVSAAIAGGFSSPRKRC